MIPKDDIGPTEREQLRENRNARGEPGLGGDKMAKELEKRGEKMKEYAKGLGLKDVHEKVREMQAFERFKKEGKLYDEGSEAKAGEFSLLTDKQKNEVRGL